MGVIEPAAGCVAMVASAGAPGSPFYPDVSAPTIVAELGGTPRSSSCSCFSATVLAAGESASSSCPGSSTLSASAVFAEALARLPCSVSAANCQDPPSVKSRAPSALLQGQRRPSHTANTPPIVLSGVGRGRPDETHAKAGRGFLFCGADVEQVHPQLQQSLFFELSDGTM